MEIIVSNLSKTPAYEQIKSQIREMILKEELVAGQQLPSIRILARELKVGIITVKHAYDDLCEEGVLYTRPGKGIYVAELDYVMIKGKNLEEVEAQLRDVKAFAGETGIGKEELMSILDKIYMEDLQHE